MPRPTRTIEIREDRYAEFQPADAAPQVELVITHHHGEHNSSGNVEALTAEELVDLHRKLTLFMASVAGQEFLSDADINYRVKISSEPDRHPEHDACRRSR